MKAVISVIGKDKVGILAMIANECANYNLNVLDVTQTIVDSMFTMTMMVAIDEMSIPLNEFAEKMENLGKEKNLLSLSYGKIIRKDYEAGKIKEKKEAI